MNRLKRNPCLLLSPRNNVGGNTVMPSSVCGLMSDWVRDRVSECLLACVRRALPCGQDTDYIFFRITFILGRMVKGQSQLVTVHKTLWAQYRLEF